MRTRGTFQEVYEAAKFYNNSGDYSDCPINPVVRRDDGAWLIESDINDRDGCDVEISLESFCGWFYDMFYNDEYIPNDNDEQELVSLITIEDR